VVGISENMRIPQMVLNTIATDEKVARVEASSISKAFINKKCPELDNKPRKKIGRTCFGKIGSQNQITRIDDKIVPINAVYIKLVTGSSLEPRKRVINPKIAKNTAASAGNIA
jgi:hypothetical protein